MTKIVITGGAGVVAKSIRQHLPTSFSYMDARPSDGVLKADLANFDELASTLDGVSAVVHAAGSHQAHTTSDLFRNNIEATSVLLRAMKQQGVDRLVLLSSGHVVGRYPVVQRIGVGAPFKPDCAYGESLALRERVVRMASRELGIDVFIIRIGVLLPRPRGTRRDRAIWISPRDLASLIMIGLSRDFGSFAVVWGISAPNADQFWDNSNAIALGYRPADNAADYPLTDISEWMFHGGPLAE